MELRDEHGARGRQVPAEGRRPLEERLPIGHVAGRELLEADGLEAAVGLGAGPCLDEPEGRDGRRVVERLELVVAEILGPAERHDRPVPVGPGEDRLGDRVAAPDRDARPRRLAARCRLDRRRRQEAEDLVADRGRVGENATLAVDDRDRHRDRLRERLCDLAEAAAAQDDPRESVVDLRGALEPDRFRIEDHPEHRPDDLVERRGWRQLDQGEVEPVCLGHHRLGDRADVASRLDGHPRETVRDQVWDQLGERRRILAERVRGRQEELVRLHPVEDVRDLHHVDGPDDPAETGSTGDEAGARQVRQLEDVGDRDTRDRAALAGGLPGGFVDRHLVAVIPCPLTLGPRRTSQHFAR